MKAKEVMQILDISRITLMKYVKKGYIKVVKLPSGQYIYDADSVFKLFNNNTKRINVIYARVSTNKQKNDLNNQIKKLKSYCKTNDIFVDHIYSEISSGLDFDRDQFSSLLNDILNYKIKNIYITDKDRLSRLSFLTLQKIFSKFGTEIIVINDDHDSDVNNDSDLLDELISLMHILSTRKYSNRRTSNSKK